MGDIGSHAENLLVHRDRPATIESLCADLSSFVPGRALDDDANLLLRFAAARAACCIASQIAAGCENDLRLRVFGSTGTLDWRQEEPNTPGARAASTAPRRLLTRGSPWLGEAAAPRVPPAVRAIRRAFIEAFANVYLGVAADIRARHAAGGRRAGERDYADVEDGARGVRFIEATVASARSDRKWTAVADPATG